MDWDYCRRSLCCCCSAAAPWLFRIHRFRLAAFVSMFKCDCSPSALAVAHPDRASGRYGMSSDSCSGDVTVATSPFHSKWPPIAEMGRTDSAKLRYRLVTAVTRFFAKVRRAKSLIDIVRRSHRARVCPINEVLNFGGHFLSLGLGRVFSKEGVFQQHA